MIKKILLITAVLLVSTGCAGTGGGRNPNLASPKGPIAQKETIPGKKPRIPSAQDLKASVLGSKESESDTTRLLEAIEKRIEQPNIVYEDIERGWYYGGVDEKKLGTPNTWAWVEEGKRSRWVSPNAVEETSVVQAEDLCRKTAGTYVISCLETDSEGCEYIPRNTCRCIEESKWQEGQGCIAVDEEEEFVTISQEELNRGWYTGLPNQKKLNTPKNWVWVDAGKNSRWQTPNPLN
ncbi:MAG: hypothetical protein V1760_03770 [Candidatus Peregrinibacteria bacterium]